jgi:hypothetical protein
VTSRKFDKFRRKIVSKERIKLERRKIIEFLGSTNEITFDENPQKGMIEMERIIDGRVSQTSKQRWFTLESLNSVDDNRRMLPDKLPQMTIHSRFTKGSTKRPRVKSASSSNHRRVTPDVRVF